MNMSRSGLRNLAAGLALSTASLLVTFVVLEAAVRLLSNDLGGKEQRETTRYTEYDPVLGWRKKANAEAAFSRRDYVTTIRTNSQGLRDRERPVAKPPGEFRVVAVGDSFVEAFMMADDQTPTAILRRALERPGCPVDVVNGGTAGYSTDQEYLAYDRDLYRYEPDVVVLFVYHNDIPPLLWGADKPVLDLTVDPPAVRNEPVPSRFGSEAASPSPDRVQALPPRPFFRSDFLSAVSAQLESAPTALRERLEALGLLDPLRRLDLNDEILLYSRRPPAHLLRALGDFQRLLGMFQRRVERDGAKFLVAYIPSRIEVVPEDWERTKARYRIGEKRFDIRAVASRLVDAASEEHVTFLDLTRSLKEQVGLFRRPYFATDSHWNARGAAAGARAVAWDLRRRGWLPDCASAD